MVESVRQIGICGEWKLMKKTVEIRKCLEEDIVRTGQFYDSVILWLDNHVNYPRWIYGVYPTVQSVQKTTVSGAQYICTDGGSILGAFALNADPQGKYQKGQWSQDLVDGSYLVIHALAIAPKMQRKGLGSDMICFCVNKAKSDGYKAIRVDIVPTNAPARRLFEKSGFTYVGDVDLELNIGNIPAFSLYELNIVGSV